MAKRKVLKTRLERIKEQEEKVRIEFGQLKDQGMTTEDAVHRLRVRYKLGRSTVYRYIKAS